MSKERMKAEMKARMKEHKYIATSEAKGINQIFPKSKVLALIYLHDVIKAFIERLEAIKGYFIPSMDVEYRMFIIELLKGISEPFKENVLLELLSPKYNISIDDVISLVDKEA